MFDETAKKAQKLYLSLLDWLIIELPGSRMQQSVPERSLPNTFMHFSASPNRNKEVGVWGEGGEGRGRG